MLNIVSGIIIDTFGELRDLRSAIDKDMESKCFICGIESTQFQRYGNGFDTHVREEHNMWQYVFLQQYLAEKEKSEFTGQESYVWSMVRYVMRALSFFVCMLTPPYSNGDTGFYPVGKSLILENAAVNPSSKG